VIRAEWTKLRTLRGWVVTMALGFVVIVALGLAPGAGGTCNPHECALPVGPGGEEVVDRFTFAHRTLTGDGRITARVASFTGELPSFDGEPRTGLVPWAKAGLILKDGTGQGSAYAAVLLTGGHGVRMQHNFTQDTAAKNTGSWLRMTRTGDTFTGQTSVDGVAWSTVASLRLSGLPSTVEAGLFVASPHYVETSREVLGLTGMASGPTRATATFDSVTTEGRWTGTGWTGDNIGGQDKGPAAPPPGTVESAGETLTLSGDGDIAPAVVGAAGLGLSLTQTLVGTFLGLVFVLVVATMSVTAEYRRGMIRTTVAASPRRARILAAKAVVMGGSAFAIGLLAAIVVITAGRAVLQGNGMYVAATSTATEIRLVLGTAALLATAAVLGVGLGMLVRRSAVAITLAVVTVVLPYLLAVTVLPEFAADWLLRVTPAAAFAVQQSALEYAQVDNLYNPVSGYFPLPPWGGFAVLAGWAAVVLAAAWYRMRKADA
jgi:ABC-type transport system involved in multi-copper enzyme maturation permease subunit